jgi:hypothetical protein
MLLKELEQGKRFMFEDRNTPLAIAQPGKGQISSHGGWVYVGTGENGCPIVRRAMDVSSAVRLVANTYYRSILPIL